MNYIWVFADFLYAWFDILVSLSESWVLFGQLDLWFLQWEKCLVLGSYRVVTFPSDRRGSKARIVLLPSRVTRWAFIVDMRLSIYIMSSCLRRYSVRHELNTLDACWIAVDVWSNSSRCRKYRSTCLGRDAYMYDHCLRYRHDFARFYQLLDSNLFTHRNICYFERSL